MSKFMKDGGHHWMRQCDSCGGWHHCHAPDDAEASPSWRCPACDRSPPLGLTTDEPPGLGWALGIGAAMAEKTARIEAITERIHQSERDGLRVKDAEIARLRADVERLTKALEAAPTHTFDSRCADALADEVDLLARRHVIDARSPAADALLDYRNPPSGERSDRLLALETTINDLGKRLEDEQRAHAETADKLAQVQASLQRQVGA